jgi:hypothetical protein
VARQGGRRAAAWPAPRSAGWAGCADRLTMTIADSGVSPRRTCFYALSNWWSGTGSNSRPSAFQAWHRPSWHMACRRGAMPDPAGVSRCLLLLLSSLLSATATGASADPRIKRQARPVLNPSESARSFGMVRHSLLSSSAVVFVSPSALLLALLPAARRPSAFQAGHILSRYGSCERNDGRAPGATTGQPRSLPILPRWYRLIA